MVVEISSAPPVAGCEWLRLLRADTKTGRLAKTRRRRSSRLQVFKASGCHADLQGLRSPHTLLAVAGCDSRATPKTLRHETLLDFTSTARLQVFKHPRVQVARKKGVYSILQRNGKASRCQGVNIFQGFKASGLQRKATWDCQFNARRSQ